MGHKTTGDSTIVKSCKLKVRNCSELDKVMETIKSFSEKYNNVSDLLVSCLTTKTIGEIGDMIPEKCHKNKYFQVTQDLKWKDKPFYTAFQPAFGQKKNFETPNIGNQSNIDNIVWALVQVTGCDKYEGNPWDLSDSSFRKQGYVQNVISNYKGKLKSLNPSIKRKDVTDSSSDEEKSLQVIYEMSRWDNLKTPEDFKSRVKHLTESNKKQKLIDRMQILANHYEKNETEVHELMVDCGVKQLCEFGGCHRDPQKQSMRLSDIEYTIKRKDNTQGYILACCGVEFDLWGRRDVIKNECELVDIINCHGKSLTFTVENGDLYIIITVDVPFEKAAAISANACGIDINTKHNAMFTTIKDDGNIKGYVNVYKLMLNDKGLCEKLKGTPMLQYIQECAEYVTFLPTEIDMLTAQFWIDYDESGQKKFVDENGDKGRRHQKYYEAEPMFMHLLDKEAKTCADNDCRIYLQNIISLRKCLKKLFLLKDNYSEHQSVYDKVEHDVPFIQTDEGKALYSEIQPIEKKIDGIMDTVCKYAYRVITMNNYGLIAMEDLTSNGIRKRFGAPTIKSILEFHGIKGCTVDELNNNETYQKFKKYYSDPTYENGRVSGIELSDKGERMMRKARINSQILKSLHFSDIKNRFIMSSNNGGAKISLVAAAYTSQIDSENDCLYTDENGKVVNKKKVRPGQEKYAINGKNADLNAALNILRRATVYGNEFSLLNKKDGYNTATFIPKINGQGKILETLKTLGLVKPITATASFSEDNEPLAIACE